MEKHTSMRMLLCILILTIFTFIQTQAQSNFQQADAIALQFKERYTSTEQLAQKLVAKLDTDAEKARVFYMWIANNVAYDCQRFHNNPGGKMFSGRNEAEIQAKIAAWQQQQLQKTLKTKKGVCEDYSRLFKALCDAVGLEAVIINGIGRNLYDPSGGFAHAWNAVKIDGKWKLIDATWAAGYTDAAVRTFTRSISTGYFFTDPDVFAINHIPEDPKWQLLDKVMTKEALYQQPYINYGRSPYRIQGFSRQVVQHSANQREIWLEFEQVPKAIALGTKAGKPIQFQKTVEGGKVVLSFTKPRASSVVIFAGESMRKQLEWIAMYQM